MGKLDYECCKQCKQPKRYPGCKSHCKEFEETDNRIKAEKEKIRKIKESENMIIGVQIESARRNIKRKHLIEK